MIEIHGKFPRLSPVFWERGRPPWCLIFTAMSPIFTRLLWRLGLVLLVLLPLSCNQLGLRVAVSQADTLLLSRIDDYFDLTDQQEVFLKIKLEEHIRWVRYNRFPVYAAIMKQTGRDIRDGWSQKELRSLLNKMDYQKDLILKRTLSDTAAFLTSLSPAQLKHFEKTFWEKTNEQKREMGAGGWRAKEEEKAIDRMEFWFDDLSESQEKLVKARVRTLPANPGSSIGQRISRMRQFVALAKTADTAQMEEYLKSMYLSSYKNRSIPWAKTAASSWYRWSKYFEKMMLEINESLTAEQKKHASDKMASLAADLLSLAGR